MLPSKGALGRVVMILLASATSLFAQTVSDSFTTSTAPNWTFGGTTTPVLTGDGVTDPVGQGWLRLTPNTGNQATYAYYNTALTAANRTFYGSFDFADWNQGAGGFADGTAFYLYDGSQAFAQGANGGSMGYAQKTGVNGKPGGYMAVAIDDWGNFSNPTEGRIGGPGFRPNSISVRGPGQGQLGYDFIAGTGDGVNAALDPTTQNLGFAGYTTRPTLAADFRHLELTLSPTGQLTVQMQFGTGGALQTVLTADLSSYTRPDTLGFGYSSGTGGASAFHEVRNFTLSSVVANLWDNGAGTGLWGTATNWNPDAVPVAGADVLLDNTFVTTAQTVDLGAVTRTVRVLTLDGSVGFTLNNGTLDFNGMGSAGTLSLNMTDVKGTADQTINANITTSGDLTVKNTTANTLTVAGTLNNNGHKVTVDGSGTTDFTGVISNTGGLTKIGTGTVELDAANTYSGGTTLSAGTIALGNNAALGTGTLTINGGELDASGGARTISNVTTLQGGVDIGGANNLTFSGQWTESGGNQTITVDNAGTTTFTGGIVLAENNQARTLTMDVASGSSVNVNSVIADGAGSGADGFTKAGTGTVTFNGANTYTGATTINAGTLAIGASDRISDSSVLNLNAGTLALNGSYSERVSSLNYNNGTIDYGTTGTLNSLLFNTAGTQAGTLTLANWENGTDHLGLLSASPAPSAAFLANVYFSGIGSGAMLSAANQTVAGYGGAQWTFIIPVVNPVYTWNGAGGNNNWSTGNNWVGTVSPPSATNTRVAFDGNVRLTPSVDANWTVNSLKFNATAGAFTLANNRITFGGTLPSLIQASGNNEVINSNVRLTPGGGGTTVIADVTGAGSLTLNGIVSEGTAGSGFTKQGNGTLVLAGANTYTGAVTINDGVVNVQNATGLGTTAGGVTVANGAALQLQGGITIGAEALTLDGTGVANDGALRNISGNNSWAGTVALNSASRINSDAGTLTVSGDISGTQNLSVGGAGNVTLSGILGTGTANLTKDGTGTLQLSGANANTFTGTTTINAGTLDLNKTAGINAINGDITIGNGATAGTVRLLASNQIADDATVDLTSTGTLNLNSFNETVNGVNSTSSAAAIQLGTGTLTINSFANSSFAGVISGTGNLVKQGADTLTLTGANTYTGTTTISAGVINVQNNTGLGTTAAGTSVTAGAALELQGGIAIGAEAMTLNGSGIAGHGAIRNVSGNNSISGNTTLASATTLGSDANTLTMSGIISGAQNMTVTGAGTVKFTGNNTYSGSTTINGTLEAGAAGALGGTSGIVLNTGGTLLFSGVGNRVRDLATFNFAGGNLKGSDLTEAMGALTLSANSTLDFVKDATRGDITFASGLLSGTPVLTINNWSGKIYAGGTDDRLFMTVAPTQAFLDSIQFTGFNRGAYWIPGTGEIVPVPEPGTILAATALLLLLGLQVLSENHSYVPALVGALRRRRPRR